MSQITKLFLTSLVLLVLSACGSDDGSGGGNTGTPTDPNTVFQTFPPTAFTLGDTTNTSYTGNDSAGGVYTATFSTQVQAQAIFLGQDAIPMLGQLQLNNTANGAFVSVVATTYYTTTAADRRYLGVDIPSGTSTVSATTTAVPQTVKIGDFGIIGTYTDNAGNDDERSWRVDDGFNGRAKLVTLSTTIDQFGDLVNSTISTSLIDTNGNSISQTLVIFYADTGITLTLNSN